MGFNSNMHAHILCVCHTNERRSAENVVQVYLPDMFTHKGGSIGILRGNGTEFKNTALNEAFGHCGIKRLFSNPFITQGYSRIKNVHNFLKRTVIKFLESSDLE